MSNPTVPHSSPLARLSVLSSHLTGGSSVHTASIDGYGKAEQAANYNTVRPDYTDQSLDCLISNCLAPFANQSQITLVDLGAGTGKFTFSLLRRLNQHNSAITWRSRIELIVVEPVESMLEQLKSQIPSSGISIIPVLASASSIPLASNSVDIVICAQAFHWFATQPALSEIHRILKPGGFFSLIWNQRVTHNPAMERLESLIDSLYSVDVPRQQTKLWKNVFNTPTSQPMFSELQETIIPNSLVQRGDKDFVVQRVFSLSTAGSRTDAEKEELRQKIIAIVESQPEYAKTGVFEIRYRTDIYWTRKTGN